MNKELKQKWIDALRSGKYKQGRRFLRSCNDNYCCLGVLCEVLGLSWVQKKGIEVDTIYILQYKSSMVDTYYSSILPKEIRLKIHKDITKSLEIENKLMHLNDDDKFTFNQIADYIEENIPEEINYECDVA